MVPELNKLHRRCAVVTTHGYEELHLVVCARQGAIEWNTLSVMTMDSERVDDTPLRQHYCFRHQGELGTWWMSWNSYGCVLYDVRLQIGYEYADRRNMLALTRSLWLPTEFNLSGRRPSVDDEFRLACVVYEVLIQDEQGVCKTMEISKWIIRIALNISYCSGIG